jgi:prepilin-type N-terminal cleavage/methylation domain-containing protein
MKHLAIPSARIARRAFTLIEAVVVIVVLAVSLPPTIMWLDQSTSRQADAASATRATFLQAPCSRA